MQSKDYAWSPTVNISDDTVACRAVDNFMKNVLDGGDEEKPKDLNLNKYN